MQYLVPDLVLHSQIQISKCKYDCKYVGQEQWYKYFNFAKKKLPSATIGRVFFICYSWWKLAKLSSEDIPVAWVLVNSSRQLLMNPIEIHTWNQHTCIVDFTLFMIKGSFDSTFLLEKLIANTLGSILLQIQMYPFPKLKIIQNCS